MFDQDIIKNVEIIRNSIYGVSELFMDDVKVIFGRIRNDSMVFDHIFNGLVSGVSCFDSTGFEIRINSFHFR